MKKLSNLALDKPVCLAVAWRDKQTIDGGRLRLTKPVAEGFRKIAKQHVESLKHRQGLEYSPEVDLQPQKEYLMANSADLGTDDPILTFLRDVASRDSLSFGALPKQPLLFYAFIFSDEATFLRKANPHQTVREGKSFTSYSDTLKRITTPVFVFDSKVDLVILESKLLISSISAFELLFKENEYLARSIPIWVDAVADRLPVTKRSKKILVDRCKSNIRLRNRLEAINSRGHLERVDLETIRAYAKHVGIDPKKIIKKKKKKLRFEDASVEDLLKLLNEDLFLGGLTGLRFAADKKMQS